MIIQKVLALNVGHVIHLVQDAFTGVEPWILVLLDHDWCYYIITIAITIAITIIITIIICCIHMIHTIFNDTHSVTTSITIGVGGIGGGGEEWRRVGRAFGGGGGGMCNTVLFTSFGRWFGTVGIDIVLGSRSFAIFRVEERSFRLSQFFQVLYRFLFLP